MKDSISRLLTILRKREYRKNRVEIKPNKLNRRDLKSPLTRSAAALDAYLQTEKPVFMQDDTIGFYRSNSYPPEHSCGNITPNYARVIATGLDSVKADIEAKITTAKDGQKVFYLSLKSAVDSVLNYADNYAAAAKTSAERKLCEALEQVPHKGARTFHEACVFMKFLLFTLRCNGNEHLTLGHFDRYMYPYFEHDKANGVSADELFETLENFFLSINFDSDLYYGEQQGDNGQSIVLGGRVLGGEFQFNELAKLCMDASLELNLIDPKINLRVCRDTPFSLYLLGTKLTKQGLGFPQYSNDDVVIPGLIALEYDEKDVFDYTVAACWEYLVPNCAMDVPNIAVFNFPKAVNDAVHEAFDSHDTLKYRLNKVKQSISKLFSTKGGDTFVTTENCDSYGKLMTLVKRNIKTECDRIIKSTNNHKIKESPYLSLFVDGCFEKGKDVSQDGAKYNNYGCLSAGIANAADALAAIKKLIYEDKSLKPEELIAALDANFVGYEALRRRLADCPKMGNNDDYVDSIASELLDCFGASIIGRENGHGGIFRAGTGSAMGYITKAKEVPATADGRFAYEPYGASFSPAITTRLDGPLSVIQSFTKYDMKKLINGGPLTIEIHDTTFRNDMGVQKVAQLVETFISLGGHQIQLNAINRDRLLEAKAHPELYPNLIVRVWGWSGYFAELAPEYQNHVISRTEFQV